MWKSCFIGKLTGVVSSTMQRCPPFFSTRHISRRPWSRFWKLRMPKAAVTASKVLSSNERLRQSSLAKEMVFSSPSRFTFCRPISIMPSDMSAPTSLSGCNIWAARMAKSPVPVAMSSIFLGEKGARRLIAFLRHPLSMSHESRWLRVS